MKFFLSFLLVCTIATKSYAKEPLLEFNIENLTQLALKNSSDKVLNDYALYILKNKKVKEYFKYKKDSQKINELVKRERKLIDESLKSIQKKAKFVYKVKTNYKSFDEKTMQINLGNQFAGTKQSVFRAYDKFKGLPSYFILLIPNLAIQNAINVRKENMDRRQKYLRKISQINNKNVYVEFILSLEKYQNQQSFQTVIEEIMIYTSDNKKSLIGSAVEKRNHSKLINEWLLSDGFTNPLVGIHAFQFAHNRLQDQLSSNEELSKICKKTKKIGIHQVIICTKRFSSNTNLIINYVGGKVAQIDLIATNDITQSEINMIQTSIKNYLKLPQLNIEYNVAKWSDYNVDFTLFSDAFKHKKSQRSRYSTLFETEPSKENRVLILSMMAHKTKKFLTDLGVKL